jgi:phosphoribosylanthranilate isomerase
MLIVKVKICGITNLEDAQAAIEMGADMLGFIFYPPSPRYIAMDAASEIINKLSASVDTVGVFVNPTLNEVKQQLKDGRLNWVQLHGDETPEFCRSLASLSHIKTMKAIRVKDSSSIRLAETYFTDAVLLDAFDPHRYGGTGIPFNWNIIGNMSKRVFLSGGINPDNVRKAIELGVYGIDICSGIESSPGKKDHVKMKKLFDNINYVRG